MKRRNNLIFLSVLVVLLLTTNYSQSIHRGEHAEEREHVYSFNQYEKNFIKPVIEFEKNFYELASHVDTIKIIRADSSEWRRIFNYDYRGLVTTVVRQTKEENIWVNSFRETYTYYVNGKLHTNLLEQWDGSFGIDWVNYRKTTLNYGGGNVSVDLYEGWTGTEWENLGLTEHENGSYGNHISSVFKYWDNGNWQLEEQWFYDYSGNGENLLSIIYQEWNGQWDNYARNLYTYDVYRRTSKIYQTWNDTVWRTYGRYTYNYDGNDNLISSVYQNGDGIDWSDVWLYTFTYDANGNETSMLRQGWWDENWGNLYRRTLAYDQNDNMILVLFEDWDDTENIWYPSSYNTVYRFYNGTVEHSPFGIRMDFIYDTYEPNVAPQEFSTIYPALLENAANLNPTFVWETAEDPGDVVNYTLFISNDPYVIENDLSAADSFFVGLDTTFSLVDSLNEDSFYYWVVQAEDFYGAITMSNITTFRVNSQNQAPNVIELLQPINSDYFETDSVYFEWSEVVDPDGDVDTVSYSLFVASDSEMNNIVFELSDIQFVTAYESVGDLEINENYWCYISASDLQGEYVNSDTVHFVVGNPVSNDDTYDNIPLRFELSQNYPNPFNPTTVIKFATPKAGMVNLAVYNLLGQKVAELINREVSAGYHNVTFDASKLSSGIYIYKLNAGKFTASKKLMLLK
jgi:hypothetical protein